MKISAVIPAYNAESFIGQALESIHKQTHPVDEIIVVDDGSTDNTQDVVHSIAPDAIYLLQQNQGPSAARNKGIAAASGDWIAFLDADDQWTAEKTAQQLAALKQYPELSLIASDMAEIDSQHKLITESVLAKHQQRAFFQNLNGAPLPNALAHLVRKNVIPTGTVLVKREVLVNAGLFNKEIRFGEDLELWAKIACHHPITCLPNVHMLRRLHGANATSSTEPMLEDLVKVMQSIKHFAGNTLADQGVNADQLVANTLWDLAYWHFDRGEYNKARQTFGQCKQVAPSRRASIFYHACALPPVIISLARKVTQSIKRIGN